MIINKKLENYINRVRRAYEIYYNALLMHGEKYIEEHINGDEDTKKMLKNLLKLLRKPEEASLGYMITVGLLGTYGEYEWFYWLAKEGGVARERSDRALHELQELIYNNEDPEIKSLIDICAVI
ncbi:MAG: hypothetical protein ACXQTS_07630 [Candidatus Methanospirareceae archaeon]